MSLDGWMENQVRGETEGDGNLDDIDLFLAACGADDRAYTCLERVSEAIGVSRAFLFDFRERTQGVEDDYRARYHRYEGILESFELIDVSLHDAIEGIQLLRSRLPDEIDGQICIDISVFSKPYFFSVLRALVTYYEPQKVSVLYTEPLEYAKEGRDYSLSSGGFEVTEVTGFSGERTDPDELLVILLGFDGREARLVVEESRPAETVAINGFPAYLLHYKDISLVENHQVISDMSQGDRLVFAPAFDPFETYNQLRAFRKEFEDHTMTIAPLGPKPMALGAAIFGIEHQDVKIAYPMPDAFGKNITREKGKSWAYPLASLESPE